MKTIMILLSLLFVQRLTAQSNKLTKENIIKDGTTITYIVKKLYKKNDTIKERLQKDTLQFQLKRTKLGLEIIRSNTKHKGNTLLDTIHNNTFYSVLDSDTDKNKDKKYRDFLLSDIQFRNDSILVKEGYINPTIYKKHPKQKTSTFLYNDNKITLPIIFYTEANPDVEFSVKLAFLDNSNFPIQTNLLYITDSQHYFSATVYKLLSIKTRE